MKLWLIDSIDLDYNQCSPEVIVADTEPEARARYMKEHPISFYSVSAYELDKFVYLISVKLLQNLSPDDRSE